MKTIRVNLPGTGYPVHFSTGGGGWMAGSVSSLSHGVIILTSPRVARFCLSSLRQALKARGILPDVLMFPDGERAKTLSTVSRIYRGLARLKADRATLVLLLGGGVVGDMGGFAASTYLRGLSFIQIPTTLVGQVDSAIGGKLGIDLPEGKNLVGVFRQPLAVYCHIPFLKTLPGREIIAGMGEVIKYGVIRDPGLFELVRNNKNALLRGSPRLLSEVVERSVRIKARVVEKDERETSGLRMILNFGHTFGHAIERLTHYKKFLHGEAVALGMIAASRISRDLGYCAASEAEKIRSVVENLGLPETLPLFTRAEWLRALEVDKKSRGGMIRFVFLKRIGEVVVQPISPKKLIETAFL